MGTLFNQSVRAWFDIDQELMDRYAVIVKTTARKHSITIDDSLALLEILVRDRANNLEKWDGDAKDEQLAGFGELWMETNRLLGEYLE